MRIFTFIIIVFLASCNTIDKKKADKGKDVLTKQAVTENKQLSPTPLKPTTDSSFLITASSLGALKLGDSFQKVEKYYTKVRAVEMESEGTSWPAKQVDLGNGEWILIESTAGMGTIDRISTNSKMFHTSSGYRIGQKLTDILKSSKNAGVDFDEGIMSVRLNDDNISLEVDEKSEELFYKKEGMELSDIRPEAKVAVFTIF